MATDAIVSFAINRLGDLLIQEAKFLYGIGDQVKQLQDELQRMRCFLKDADGKQCESERIRNWISEIREAAYEAEDVLERSALQMELKRQGGSKGTLKRFGCILSEGVTWYKIGYKIKKITTRLSKIGASMRDYGIQEALVGEGLVSWRARKREQRQSFPHVMEGDLVGIESSVEALVQDLVDEEKRFRVLSICGMGGLGKTTLARQVYHDSKVRRYFDHFAWAYISQECRRRDTWEGILISFSSENNNDNVVRLRDQELVAKLYEFLKINKCLVVLDDIWGPEAWDSLKDAFPYETRSRIMLTSRNKELALHADQQGLLHEPQCLQDEESWELLKKIAFPRRNDNAGFREATRMEELGKRMVKTSGGLPLAIRVLGGLLARKCTLDQWKKIHENIRKSFRRGIDQQHNHLSVDDILSLSYDDLPSQLKSCFLYLGHFPEDYEIPVKKLMKLWAAEGLITSVHDEERMVEDVAECYVDELIERSMVLVGRRDIASSKVETCRLHDLMRDLCLLKAKQESFLQVIDAQSLDAKAHPLPSSSIGKYRRLAVHLFRDADHRNFHQKLIKNYHLRSLLYSNTVVNNLTLSNKQWKLFEPSFKSFAVLRVLDLEGAILNGGKLPRDIGKLIHLRFLSFKDGYVLKFPSSLGNLRLLETLDLRVAYAYLPDVLWKLKRLRHLYLPREFQSKKWLRLGNLMELQTLVNFQPGICNVRDLFSQRNLKTLEIYCTSKTPALMEIMSASLTTSLRQLQSLALSSSEGYHTPAAVDVTQLHLGFVNLSELALNFKIRRFADGHQFSSDITSITLGACELKQDPMPVLEKLPRLRLLVLCSNALTGYQMFCSRFGFPQLLSLSLHDLKHLEELRFEEGAMPKLTSLYIDACKKLKMLPAALKGIPSLQILNVEGMPKEFVDKLVPGGDDFYKIQHVPSVVFTNNDWY